MCINKKHPANSRNARCADKPPGGHPSGSLDQTPTSSLYGTINKERKLMRKRGDWKNEQGKL